MLKNTSLAAAFSAITLCSVSICNAEEILKPKVGTEENIAIEKKEGVVPGCQVNPDTKIFKNLFGLRSLFNKTSSIFGVKGAEKIDLTNPNGPNSANKVDANGLPLPSNIPEGNTGGRDARRNYARNSSNNMFGDMFMGGSGSSKIPGPNINVRTIGGTLFYPNGTPAPFSPTQIPSNGVATNGQITTLSLQTFNLTKGTSGQNTNSFVVPVSTVTFNTPGTPAPTTGQYLVYTSTGTGTGIITAPTALNNNAFVTSIVEKSLLPGESISSSSNNCSTDGNVTSVYFIQSSQLIDTNLPTPASGGVVGRTKISDDNNPLPRDRIIFNFDYFNNVPLIQDGFNVFRYNFGFEKSFLDQRASIQMLFPVASSVDSTNLTTGGAGEAAIGSRTVQFGNMSIILKYLFGSNEKGAIAGGLGFTLPTAPGTNLYDLQGNKLVELQNQSLILTPYIAGLYTPTENLFAQAWIATNFDASGSRVKGYPTSGSTFQSIGKFNDTSVLQVDAQVGYWIINPNYSMRRNLRGLAPFFELHYNGTMGDYDVVQAGRFMIRDNLGRYDEFNISAGLNTQIRDDLNVMFGAVTPLSSDTNRHFDYQLGVHVNYFFGATSKARYSNTVRNINDF